MFLNVSNRSKQKGEAKYLDPVIADELAGYSTELSGLRQECILRASRHSGDRNPRPEEAVIGVHGFPEHLLRAHGNSVSCYQGRETTMDSLHAQHRTRKYTVHGGESSCLHGHEPTLKFVKCRG